MDLPPPAEVGNFGLFSQKCTGDLKVFGFQKGIGGSYPQTRRDALQEQVSDGAVGNFRPSQNATSTFKKVETHYPCCAFNLMITLGEEPDLD